MMPFARSADSLPARRWTNARNKSGSVPTRRPLRLPTTAASLLLVAAGTAACGGSTESDVADAQSMTVQIDGALTSYDPVRASTFSDIVALWSMYDTLVAMNPNGEIIDGLATDWRVEGQKTTFDLRDGVTCSDGEKLTGAVVADSLNRFFDPKNAAPILNLVIGSNNTARAEGSGQQVTITLDRPFSGLLMGLTLPHSGIVCSAGTKDPEKLKTGAVGTGGYTPASQVTGDSYTFERRDGYDWSPTFNGVTTKGQRPKKLTLKVVEDENTRANLQTTGQMQVAAYTTDAYKRVAKQDGWRDLRTQQTDTFMVFNHNDGHATADRAVRRAVTQAVDVDRLVDIQSYGEGERIYNLGQPTYACYDESLKSVTPEYDPAAARSVLEGKRVRVVGSTLIAGGDANAYVASQLRKAGAKVDFRNLTNQQWVAGMFKPRNDWDVTIVTFANTSSTLINGTALLTGQVPPNGTNIGDLQFPEADAALTIAREGTGERACQAMSDYQRLMLENSNILPLGSVPATVMFAPGVSGMVTKGFVHTGTLRVASE